MCGFYTSTSQSVKEVGAGTQAEKLEAGGLEGMLFRGSVCLLTTPRAASPGVAAFTVIWAFPHESLKKITTGQLGGIFSQLCVSSKSLAYVKFTCVQPVTL